MNKLPIISVLMCTYNGEKYIIEQLESIRRQVYQPDNVLIYDDCSEDLTVNIINNYISKYNLSSVWKVSINSVRKGWRINFFDALLKCNDDFIFFCDQDDIWHPDKISLCMKIMHENPNVLLVNGLFELIDSSGNPIKNHNWTRNNVYNQKLIKVNLLDTMYFWKHRKGCTMVIRKIVKEQIKHFDKNHYFAHDKWAQNISALLNGCYYFNYPVIKYRIHENNASRIKSDIIHNRAERINHLEYDESYLQYIFNGIKSMDISLIDKYEYINLQNIITINKYRKSFVKDSKLFLIFPLFMHLNIYIKYLSFRFFFIDILDAFKLSDFIRYIKHLLLNRFS